MKRCQKFKFHSPGNMSSLFLPFTVVYPEGMKISSKICPPDPIESANLQLAERCFRDAEITDELCPASIKKYTSSLRTFFAVVVHKDFARIE